MENDNQYGYDMPEPVPVQEEPKPQQEEPKPKQNSMALASLVLGIIAVVTSCCCYGGLVFGSLGILFALLSRVDHKFEGYALAGLIISVAAMVLVLVLIVVVLLSGMLSMLGGIY